MLITLCVLNWLLSIVLGVRWWYLEFEEVSVGDVMFFAFTSLIPVSTIVLIILLFCHYVGKTGYMNKRLF